ncbi:MAG: T9SS type A sorting domain-containing protein [Bacteroidales bacterium]|jgi:hypothetical protein|nr:T9SS type A sorting domain-containing protein [Bacteroidales bacterium]
MRNNITIKKVVLTAAAIALLSTSIYAEQWVGSPTKKAATPPRKAADCLPAAGSSFLEVNNVRAYIETSGSMWFKSIAQYFIPKNGQASSLFASALWIGGKDFSGQLKLAAIRFRQNGNDFWPGPLDLQSADIDQSTCTKYDKHFRMTKVMAYDHMLKVNNPLFPDYVIPKEIEEWPGNPIDDPDHKKSPFIAPFMDVDGDMEYRPENGDYPYYDFEENLCPWTPQNRLLAARDSLPKTYETMYKNPKTGISYSSGGILADQVLKGDETLWWILNDKGAAHTETQGSPIGLEIRAQAFGFTTTDELNNMTFYSYEIINRSTFDLTETYFSQWVDADLGYAQDDYIGCDVERGLGYCYNGKDIDGTGLPQHYGANPPAVGVDFFQGPYLDPDGYDNPSYKGSNLHGPSFEKNYDNVCQIVTADGQLRQFTWDSVGVATDGKDSNISVTRNVLVRAAAINGVNFGDGIVDNERYGMRRFVYHNNDQTKTGDPSKAVEYYNMLRGYWKDNSRMRFGKTGHQNETGTTAPECDFMYPGDSDPCHWGTKGETPTTTPNTWTDRNENSNPADRRFMQSAGPFTLKAGAVNYITVGIPWARAIGNPWASVELLRIVDDKAQSLFESCFIRLEGPWAPDLSFVEMNEELICHLTNPENSNNYQEQYVKEDYSIAAERVVLGYKYVQDTSVVVDSITVTGMGDTIYHTSTKIKTLAVETRDTIKYSQDERSYHFEGYKVYQLADATVEAGELDDITKAQLVFQCDIKNGITSITNFEFDESIGQDVPVVRVQGADAGIQHAFSIKEDKFGGGQLMNYQKYYYMAIAYAYNCYAPYSIDADNPDGLLGQKKPYLQGDKNARVYTVIPHKNTMQENGMILNSSFGSSPQITQYEGHGNGGNALELTPKSIAEILANNYADSLVFEVNRGPIKVEVIDPLRVKGYDYTLRFFNPTDTFNTTNLGVTEDTKWVLSYTNENDSLIEIFSDMPVSKINQQILIADAEHYWLDLGIAITANDARFTPLDYIVNQNTPAGYYLLSTVSLLSDYCTMSYSQPGVGWMYGIADGENDMNWVRAGTTSDGDMDNDLLVSKWIKEDYYFNIRATDAPNTSGSRFQLWYDKDRQFNTIINGWFAPYTLTSKYHGNPKMGYEAAEVSSSNYKGISVNGVENFMTELYSVDIVMTSDTTKWTRCPVVEIGNDPAATAGHAVRHNLRKAYSVYCNGEQNTSETGMGWFPGYVICPETGERLNVMFGENSMYPGENGADMIFNPYESASPYRSEDYEYVAGGGHFLYIFGHQTLRYYNPSNWSVSSYSDALTIPTYDQGAKARAMLVAGESSENNKVALYKNVMWVGMPLHYPGKTWLEPGNDLTIKLRVTRPYQKWRSTANAGVAAPANGNMPLYKFSTRSLVPLYNQKDVAKGQMDSINIVPNPYYGIATKGYEATQYETKVKFINLPNTCQIKIYTLNGTLVRSLDKPDNGTTYYEWDLKNTANIPIASGLYIIHIRNNEYGTEKTLKFMCVQRPVDVIAF